MSQQPAMLLKFGIGWCRAWVWFVDQWRSNYSENSGGMHHGAWRVLVGDWWLVSATTIAAIFSFWKAKNFSLLLHVLGYPLFGTTPALEGGVIVRRCHGVINSTGKWVDVGRMTSPSTTGNQSSKWLDNITRIVVGKWNDCGFFRFWRANNLFYPSFIPSM